MSSAPVAASGGTHSAGPSGLLAEIAVGLAAGGDLGELLERFLEPVIRLAGANGGVVRMLSDAGDSMQVVCSLGLPDSVLARGTVAHADCGHCGQAARQRELVSATDLSGCALRSGSRYFGEGCRRLLAVPLQHRGLTLGVYNLFFSGDAEPAADVQRILRSVGDLLGLAIHNARLEQAQLRATLLQERQAMAADVHDSLGQSLAYVKMRLPLLHDAMRGGDTQLSQQYYDDIRAAVSQAHASLRGILTQLRAPMDPRGLLPALGATADAFRRRSGVDLVFDNAVPDLSLPHEQETQVFHIVSEALSNVARHAGASHAWLRLARDPAGAVRLVVEDDGSGLPPQGGGHAHYGLEIMADRARRLGGALEVAPRPGGGTRVQLTFTPAGPAAATGGPR